MGSGGWQDNVVAYRLQKFILIILHVFLTVKVSYKCRRLAVKASDNSTVQNIDATPSKRSGRNLFGTSGYQRGLPILIVISP